jgi:hypothetical protein
MLVGLACFWLQLRFGAFKTKCIHLHYTFILFSSLSLRLYINDVPGMKSRANKDNPPGDYKIS